MTFTALLISGPAGDASHGRGDRARLSGVRQARVARRGRPTAPPMPPPRRRGCPAHQASADPRVEPTGVPSSRPRSVSMTGVTGWCAAKPCSHDGIVSTGTNALLGVGQEHHDEREPVRPPRASRRAGRSRRPATRWRATNSEQDAGGGEPVERPGVGPEADARTRRRTPARCEATLRSDAGGHVAGEHRRRRRRPASGSGR